jgi:hypothetical protein
MLARLDELIEKTARVLGTERFPPPGVFSAATLSSEAFAEWQTQCLSFLVNLLGEHDVYVESFREKVTDRYSSHAHAGKGILTAVREDVAGGHLRRLQTLVAAEVFSDFVEMGEHLLEAGYKDPAASLAGAVLENGLRRIAAEGGIKLKTREDIGSLNAKLAQANVYNRLTQKKVQVWNDVRNHADHGEFDQYSEADVRDMLKGVTDLLGAHLD